MAILAGELRVNILQFKAGVLVVIEFDLEPAAFRMAAITLLAVIALVDVIHLMTEETVTWRIGVPLIGVAVRTCNILVPLFQFEIGLFVVES